MKKLMLCLLFFAPLLLVAQTDTTAKLKDAQLQWAAFNAGGNDTSMIAALYADYGYVLAADSLNKSANQGIGDLYNSMANYWVNLAQPIQVSNPSLYNTYMNRANNYFGIASPYLQKYLTLIGVSH
jgi:hypothetical protein